ncbi:hypothetical protein [Photobacterium damselae]|nr:hypothetical protein [Photobacterium damselae]
MAKTQLCILIGKKTTISELMGVLDGDLYDYVGNNPFTSMWQTV